MATITNQHHELIGSVLLEHAGLGENDFSVEDIERAKNNHVYAINLAQPTTEPLSAQGASPKPHTSSIPVDTSRMIMRIPKLNVSMEDSVRVRNEVAFLAVGRDALSPDHSSLIPLVFGWDDASESQWILEEWKDGQVLNPDEVLARDDERQSFILNQLAHIVKRFQEYRLPASVTGYGGLTFDLDGTMTSTASSIPCGGPFPSYREFLKGMCLWQLDASERSSHLNGWRDLRKLRPRIDAFFDRGLDPALAEIPEDKLTLIHADLGFTNLLFDPATYRLTAVLDFDFSHIGSPISEYLFSFYDLDSILPGSAESRGPLRQLILMGFPEGKKKMDSRWRLARAWHIALDGAGVQNPATIEYAGRAADIWWFSQELCQAYWHMEKFIANRNSEGLMRIKEGDSRKLEKYLRDWGF